MLKLFLATYFLLDQFVFIYYKLYANCCDLEEMVGGREDG